MKITKPDITISDWEFSLPNGPDTVAFFDPTLDDAKIAVVRKADADVIKASEKVIDALIEAHEVVEHFNMHTEGRYDEELADIEDALKESGCTIHNS